jgi:hypothetical protein
VVQTLYEGEIHERYREEHGRGTDLGTYYLHDRDLRGRKSIADDGAQATVELGRRPE